MVVAKSCALCGELFTASEQPGTLTPKWPGEGNLWPGKDDAWMHWECFTTWEDRRPFSESICDRTSQQFLSERAALEVHDIERARILVLPILPNGEHTKELREAVCLILWKDTAREQYFPVSDWKNWLEHGVPATPFEAPFHQELQAFLRLHNPELRTGWSRSQVRGLISYHRKQASKGQSFFTRISPRLGFC